MNSWSNYKYKLKCSNSVNHTRHRNIQSQSFRKYRPTKLCADEKATSTSTVEEVNIHKSALAFYFPRRHHYDILWLSRHLTPANDILHKSLPKIDIIWKRKSISVGKRWFASHVNAISCGKAMEKFTCLHFELFITFEVLKRYDNQAECDK